MSDQSATVSWWNPEDGWLLQAPPTAYLAMLSDEAEFLWENNGYERIAGFGDLEKCSSVDLQIWRNIKGHHYCIQVCSLSHELGLFFVGERMFPAFIADKLPAMVAGYGLSYSEQLDSLRTMLIAFIRHGHGERTIDESGLWTLDEVRNANERARTRKTAS